MPQRPHATRCCCATPYHARYAEGALIAQRYTLTRRLSAARDDDTSSRFLTSAAVTLRRPMPAAIRPPFPAISPLQNATLSRTPLPEEVGGRRTEVRPPPTSFTCREAEIRLFRSLYGEEGISQHQRCPQLRDDDTFFPPRASSFRFVVTPVIRRFSSSAAAQSLFRFFFFYSEQR